MDGSDGSDGSEEGSESSDGEMSFLDELAAAASASRHQSLEAAAVEAAAVHASRFIDEAAVEKVVHASHLAGQGLRAMQAPHVLIVEDTEMCAMVLTMMLKKVGCSCDHAQDGAEAVEMLKNAEVGLYSFVLMDLRMPVMDGFEATTILKSKLKLTLPIVALTAEGGAATRERCVEVGFDDFAAKPLKHDALVALLAKHTGHEVVCSAT